ncbi:MAG: regulatory protein RecX [Pseudomonadota bacterium]
MSDGDTRQDDCAAAVRLAAMNLLARREHSRSELALKLGRRFSDEKVVQEQIRRLADECLQSDRRFAESFVRQRVERGCGPLRITRELRQRGVDQWDIDGALTDATIDWAGRAVQVVKRKFGGGKPLDVRERARWQRFLEYRGFSSEHYRRFMDEG